MDFESFDNDDDASKYLYFFTQNLYVFALSSERCWNDIENIEHAEADKPFYQIMPDSEDDGFFDWYCHVRPYNQFFKTKEVCVLYFTMYWTEWGRSGKPN